MGIGFVEDRGAALSLDSARTFKFQHNTDTDLKVVHVYPEIDPAAVASSSAAARSEAEMTPEELIIFSPLKTFQRMVAAKTPSLNQRKRVLELLKGAKADFAEIEGKLASMTALTPEEQSLYDELDCEVIDEKHAWLMKQMDESVATGQLTRQEQQDVLDQLATKLEAVEIQLAAAESEGKSKKAEKLRQVHEGIQQRREVVRTAPPITRKPKFEAEIKAARKKLAELEKLEKSKDILPLETIQRLNAKPKLIGDLEAMDADAA